MVEAPASSAPEPVLEGVFLSAYARVVAARSEGFPLALALEHAGVDPRVWPAADQAWSRRLASTAAEDAALVLTFEARTIEAQDALRRRIPPIDEDLGAWLDFLRGWAESEDPLGRLDQMGLRSNDILRLQRHWARRLEAEETLQIEAAAILGRPPRDVQVARPAEATFEVALERRPAPAGPQAARFPRLAAPMPVEEAALATTARKPNPLAGTSFALDVPLGPALPFAGGSAPALPSSRTPANAEVPRVATPHKAPPSLTGTSLALEVPRGSTLPFAAGATPPTAPPLPPSAQPTATAASIPEDRFSRAALPGLAGTSLALDIPRSAALPFVAGTTPPPNLTPRGPEAPAPRSPPSSLTGTSFHFDVPRAPALPFNPIGIAGPSAMAPANAPTGVATVSVPEATARRAPPPGLAGTVLALDVPRGPALPFAAGSSGAPPLDPAAPTEREPEKGRE
jgi:hypothetical protein